MLLLLDVGNTHTHLGLANARRVLRAANISTAGWFDGKAADAVRRFVGTSTLDGAACCSVVPAASPRVRAACRKLWRLTPFQLTAATLHGIGVDYPKPSTIGPDRLANALAVRHHYGAPAVVVDFGTAVTFDVVDRKGDYVGGIIAPGLAAMTDYLHEKTALLPRIRLRQEKAVIGRNTGQAMRIGALHGYRGLIRELLIELRQALRSPRLPVVATGGYARIMASNLPLITAVQPLLTLEGLRLAWEARDAKELG